MRNTHRHALWLFFAIFLVSGCSDKGSNPSGGGNGKPRIKTTSPAGASVDVAVTSNIAITFNMAMDTAAVLAALTVNPPAAGAFSWSADGATLTLDPHADFSRLTQYTVSLTAIAKSQSGAALEADTSFSFLTVGGVGASAAVVSTVPQDDDSLVSPSANLVITFNMPMDVTTTEKAISSSPLIMGAFSWDQGDTRLTWNPDPNLTQFQRYQVTVLYTAKSKTGLTMGATHSFAFTTGKDTTLPTLVAGTIARREDSMAVAGANVILYNANTNTALQRTLSDAAGRYQFSADSGNFYLTVTALGRIPSPPPGGRYTPFRVDVHTTYARNFLLRRDSSGVPSGSLAGSVAVSGSTSLGGILIVAMGTDSVSHSTTTGPDGVFVFSNLPAGTYELRAYRSGLAQDTALVQAAVKADSVTQGVSLKLATDPGRRLEGKITFLASQNATVDITLVDPITRDAIPGLSTVNDAGLNYQLAGIPPGDYIAWGSYRNDGYVMDPDRIRKFGLPAITFLPSDTLKQLGFEFTGAVAIFSPSNHKDSLYPAPVNSLTPTFKWEKYPSTQEYIVEVFDSKGTRIWGGWDSAGNVLHAPIPFSQDTVVYNFDGSAKEPLRRTDTYSWKVYADKGGAPGVQQLISSSEDLMGLFMAGVSAIPIDSIPNPPRP